MTYETASNKSVQRKSVTVQNENLCCVVEEKTTHLTAQNQACLDQSCLDSSLERLTSTNHNSLWRSGEVPHKTVNFQTVTAEKQTKVSFPSPKPCSGCVLKVRNEDNDKSS